MPTSPAAATMSARVSQGATQALGQRVSRALHSLSARVFLDQPFAIETLRETVLADNVFPFSVALVRPHMTYRLGAAIVAPLGRELPTDVYVEKYAFPDEYRGGGGRAFQKGGMYACLVPYGWTPCTPTDPNGPDLAAYAALHGWPAVSVYEGHTAVYNHSTQMHDIARPCRGHLGPSVYPGCGKVWKATP